MSPLKPCPSAHQTVRTYRTWTNLGERWFGGCTSCAWRGPLADTEAEAITAWNTRTDTNSDLLEAVTHEERVEYEERILAVEMELERARKVLTPFATKACGWEQNHPGQRNTDSTQVSHRLGDFRAARTLLHRFDRIADGMIERPFAYCCAEAGGHVDACDCVNKNHGTAWFAAIAKYRDVGTHSTHCLPKALR